MKKFYTLFFTGAMLLSFNSNTQINREVVSVKDKASLKLEDKKKLKKLVPLKSVKSNDVQCGWIDLASGADYSIFTLTDEDDDGVEFDAGFLAGTNVYGDKGKANFYDFSSTSITKIDSVAFYSYTDVSDFALPLNIAIYDGTTGKIGTKLAQANTTFAAVADAEEAEEWFSIKIPTFTLPASKKVFISVEFSALDWALLDDFTLYSTEDPLTVNYAWEKWSNDTWNSFETVYPTYKTAFSIYPYICADVTTPVALGQLAASNNSFGNTISWSSISETANKGFEVQRSTDGVNFTTIAFVASKALNGNSSSTIQYSYIDENPAIGENYYRVKQVDLNANSSFTNIAKIIKGLANTDGLTLYPNPAKDRLNIALNSLNGKKSTITVFNNNGKSVRQISLLGTGSLLNTSVSLDGLANGLYFIKVETEGKIESSRFVKN